MSVVEWTGRARARTMRCWRCGQRAEHVLYEIRDTEANTSGTERLCCNCGKSSHGWGLEHRFWLGEKQKELVRSLLVAHWLADQIVCSARRRADEQLSLFGTVSA
ncbi:hypothetical protein [Streptomyces sp. NPDC047042]|uniref:hypothetical protein n=1 Tax=Streptomyces sp. NPDC047042 TaxID=3154807 RepID=UPI0033FE0E53